MKVEKYPSGNEGADSVQEHHAGDESSVGDSANADPTSSTKQGVAEQERRTLGRQETKAVVRWKYTLLFILLATAIAVSLCVYFFAHNKELEQFESTFLANADSLLGSFSGAIGRQLGAIDALSVSIASHVAEQDGVDFPMVTIPFFEWSGTITRVLAGGLWMMWMPLVSDDQRDDWEEFARLNQNHVFNSSEREDELRMKQDAYFGLESVEQIQFPDPDTATNIVDQPFHNGIWDVTSEGALQAPGTGPYLPIWQTSPSLPQPGRININMLGHRAAGPALKEMLRSDQATLGFLNTGDTPDAALFLNQVLLLGQYRHEKESFVPGDALSPLAYPVHDLESGKVVGALFSNFYWRLYLADILPPNVRGIICVLENSRGQTVSYQIDGRDAAFLGVGDLHDPEFDEYVQTADIVSFVTERSSPVNFGYSPSAVGLNPDFVSYEIRVYPSEDTKEDYITNQPIIYAFAVAIMFGFTSTIFLIYNYSVENRQAVVMDRAVKSTAVVSSLFPEQVRDRLLNDAEPKEDEGQKTWLASGDKRDNRVTSFLEKGGDASMRHTSAVKSGGRPIADRYENTTVMFADMVGFTQWSSQRDPEQVFTLLESVYGAFDAIATRRAVFKVETIGDCYMCVTGLPHAQPDHGIRMAKFARDCLTKMDHVTKELAPLLGPGTDSLALRIGLNSGDVTAGVLRGEKSRFQLFGDTVNTASRMESNGERNRIHLSQSTADELIKSGKASCLEVREDVISVKGKGDLQTYFFNMAGAGTVPTTTSDNDKDGSSDGSSGDIESPASNG